MSVVLQFPAQRGPARRDNRGITVTAKNADHHDIPAGVHPDSYYRSIHDLRSAIQAYRVTISRLALSAGLHEQQLALLEIVRGHPLYPHATVGDIARDFRHEPHTVSALITRAEKEGLIVRVRGPRNVAYPVLTRQGQTQLDQFISLALTEGEEPLRRVAARVVGLFQRFLARPRRGTGSR